MTFNPIPCFCKKSFLLFFILTLGSTSFVLAEETKETAAQEQEAVTTLDVGDKFYYSVIEDRRERIILFVDEQGNINVPLVGEIKASGKAYDELTVEIEKILERDYYNQATVVLSPYQEDNSRGKVFLLGQISNQGPVDIPKNDLLTVTKAILLAGGFTQTSDTTSVSLTRRDPTNPEEEVKLAINVRDILEKGELDKDMVLKPGDVIFVPEKGEVDAKVFVVGEVKAPGYYSIPPGRDFTITQAILQAGGFTEFADQDDVKLVKGDTSIPEKERTLVVDVEEIFEEGNREHDYKLQNNDMIIVDEKWINF